MRYLSLIEILELHNKIISSSGGINGIRDMGGLESAINQPKATFDQKELYLDLSSKAATLCFSLIMNHPFIDGNKRVGHAAMETFLILNYHEIDAEVDEQEAIILQLASGQMDRAEFTLWLKKHITNRSARR